MTKHFRQRSIDPGQQPSSKALTQITLGYANPCSFGSEPGRADAGIWTEFGPTRLSFLEYLLIGIGSSIFPRELLNREGHNRAIEITSL